MDFSRVPLDAGPGWPRGRSGSAWATPSRTAGRTSPPRRPARSATATRTFGGERTNIVYYSDVRISDRYRLGGVNDGWSVLHGPLDEEHGVGRDGSSARLGDRR